MPVEKEIVKAINKYSDMLEKEYMKKQPKRAEIMFGLFGVMDPKKVRGKLSLKFWAEVMMYYKLRGWKTYVVRL